MKKNHIFEKPGRPDGIVSNPAQGWSVEAEFNFLDIWRLKITAVKIVWTIALILNSFYTIKFI